MDFSKASQQEREQFSALLTKHGAQNCKSCGAAIVIEGCHSSGCSTEWGTGYSVMTVACNACGADVVTASSWWPDGHDDVEGFLDDLEDEWA